MTLLTFVVFGFMLGKSDCRVSYDQRSTLLCCPVFDRSMKYVAVNGLVQTHGFNFFNSFFFQHSGMIHFSLLNSS